MSVNVMLAGAGFFQRPVAGDKNFWIRIAPLLQERGARLVALSVNDRTGSDETPNGLKIVNLKRSFHLGDPERFHASIAGATDYKHQHSRVRDSMELLLTAARNLRAIRSIIESEGVQVVHFMDNMGPAMRFLERRLPGIRFTNSQLRYNGGRMYNAYIRASMLGLDATVAYSESCRGQLIAAGIPADQIAVIRWGVEPTESEPDPALVRSTREKQGVAEGHSLILWSGFILHIQRPDFEAAVLRAAEIASRRPDCRFVFSFKPLCFDPGFKRFEAERVTVIGDLPDFPAVLASADFFLSPSTRPDASVAPPLTWIEAMNSGVPIITTRGPGVEEAVEDRRSGYIADSMDTIGDTVDAALDAPNRSEVRRNCRAVVREKFNINNSADQYVRLWETVG